MTPEGIIQGVNDLLADAGQRVEHWSPNEKFRWANEAALKLSSLRPETSAMRVAHPLTVGQTNQNLDANWLMILEIHDIVGGAHLHRVDMRDADAGYPGWRGLTGTPVDYILTEFERSAIREFFVLPGPAVAATLNMVVSVDPRVSAITDEMIIPRSWEPALVNYVVYRCLSKQHKEGEQNMSRTYLQEFNDAVGVQPGERDLRPQNQQHRRRDRGIVR